MNKNALVEKLTSRFSRKVEDAVWDMATGTIGLKSGDSVFTLDAVMLDPLHKYPTIQFELPESAVTQARDELQAKDFE